MLVWTFFGIGAEAVEVAQAKEAGAKFEWKEGGVTSQQGQISEEQWEIFKLAFLTTGRIAILSDQNGEGWMYDYRFLEAVG